MLFGREYLKSREHLEIILQINKSSIWSSVQRQLTGYQGRHVT